MALSFVGGDYDGSVTGGNITLTAPGGIAEDDFVIVSAGDGTLSNQTMSMVTSGFTTEADLYANDSYDSNLGLFYKLMGGTPDSTFVVTGSGDTEYDTAAAFHCWRGIDTSTPLDQTTTTATGTNSPDTNPPSITTVTDNAQVIAIGSSSDGTADPSTSPSGYSNEYWESSNGGSDLSYQGAGLASKLVASAGAEDPGIWDFTSGSTESWCAATMALRPAADPEAEQEGYRWRNDDGSETTATWKENQDTTTSIAKTTTTRLRVIIATTNDYDTTQFQLEVVKNGDASSEWEAIV